jgi:hypothetical protein
VPSCVNADVGATVCVDVTAPDCVDVGATVCVDVTAPDCVDVTSPDCVDVTSSVSVVFVIGYGGLVGVGDNVLSPDFGSGVPSSLADVD